MYTGVHKVHFCFLKKKSYSRYRREVSIYVTQTKSILGLVTYKHTKQQG